MRRQYVWEYDREEAADVAKEVSQECTARVKAALGEQPRSWHPARSLAVRPAFGIFSRRYKLICHVVVSENVQQSFSRLVALPVGQGAWYSATTRVHLQTCLASSRSSRANEPCNSPTSAPAPLGL